MNFSRDWTSLWRALGADTFFTQPDLLEEIQPVLVVGDVGHRSPLRHLARLWVSGTTVAVVGEFSGIQINAGSKGCWVKHLVNRNTAGQAALYLGDVANPFNLLLGTLGACISAPEADTPLLGQTNQLPFLTRVVQGSTPGVLGSQGPAFPIVTQIAGDQLGPDGVYLPPLSKAYFFGLTANTAQTYQLLVEEPDA